MQLFGLAMLIDWESKSYIPRGFGFGKECEKTNQRISSTCKSHKKISRKSTCIINLHWIFQLKKMILMMMTLTKRSRILDAHEDIFAYIRDRYFINEHVHAVIGNLWFVTNLK